jgi:hypothetical protein
LLFSEAWVTARPPAAARASQRFVAGGIPERMSVLQNKGYYETVRLHAVDSIGSERNNDSPNANTR